MLNLTPGRQALYLYLWGNMSNQSWQLPLLPYYRWRNWGTSQLSNLPRISHIARLWRTWIQTQEIHSRVCYSLITLLCRLRLGAWQRGIKCLWIEATWKTKPSHRTSTGKPPRITPHLLKVTPWYPMAQIRFSPKTENASTVSELSRRICLTCCLLSLAMSCLMLLGVAGQPSRANLMCSDV